MPPLFTRTLSTCALMFIGIATAVTAYAAEDTVSDQSVGTLKRLVSRISSTRETVMLGAICHPGTITLKKDEAGCMRCPSYTGQPDGAGNFAIGSIITGTFLKPNVSEALLSMSGCESRADASGGLVLLGQSKGGWKRIWYKPGHQLADCLKFLTTRNVQSLLCNRSDIAQGIENGELVWVSIDEHGLKVSPMLPWYDNIQSNPRELVVVYPSRMFRSDYNQDGRGDVQITFRLLEHRIPPEYSGALDAIDQGYRLPEAQKLKIVYLFDGTGLVTLPNSEPAVATIRALLEKHTERSGE